ncbi:MAG: protein-methionine-sulfoxide reductase heme-binding subunit MsrQ [Pseudomonadota bacterium]
MGVADRLTRTVQQVPAWVIYAGAVCYAAWMLWLGIDNRLGADPVKTLEHAMGEAALYFMVAGLCVSPLRDLARINLMKFRRAIGVTCFLFVLLHLLVWALLDVQRLGAVWADIVKRPYITVGMAGFALMVPLVLTSNNVSVRRMGAAAWRRLHQLVYPAALLGGVHFVMQAKGFQIRPLFFLMLIVLLVGWRIFGKRALALGRRTSRRTL